MGILFATNIAGMWFLASAWSKLRDPRTFSEIVPTYPLPGALRSAHFIRAVPIFESATGLALLSAHPRVVSLGACVALLFIACASLMVAIRWTRGERRFRCGCGGDLAESSPAAEVLARNLGLAALLAVSVWGAGSTSYPIEAVAPALLTGCGAVIGARLAGAARSAWGFSKEWNAPG